MSQDIQFVIRFSDDHLSILDEIELRKFIAHHEGEIEDVKVFNEDGSEYLYDWTPIFEEWRRKHDIDHT